MKLQKKINLGCGYRFHNDWVNLDFIETGKGVIKHDLSLGIPFSREEFDVVYHSHVLEHFSQKNAFDFMKECYRVLKPNGIIRVVVPDLERTITEYLSILNTHNDINLNYKYDWIMLELFDQFSRKVSGGNMRKYILNAKPKELEYIYNRIGQEARAIRETDSKILKRKRITIKKLEMVFSLQKWYNLIIKFILSKSDYQKLIIGKFVTNGENHLWMYDKLSIKKLLETCGYKNIKITSAIESDIDNWKNYYLDADRGEIIYKPDSLFIEARK